jgi:hypothetical protein
MLDIRSSRYSLQKLLQVVLTAWREADRVASERPETSKEHEAALVAAERLRVLYTELVASAKADNDGPALASAEAIPSPRPSSCVAR